jgi:WhiB family redox-sensing transcriptional regulator
MGDTMTDWMADAACAEVGTDLFYPDTASVNRAAYADAINVCAACPVATQCLEHAIATDERYGVWGGTTPADREAMRQARGLRRRGGNEPFGNLTDAEFLSLYEDHMRRRDLAGLGQRLGYASADSLGRRARQARVRLGIPATTNQYAAATHCIHGHEFAGDNLIIEAGGRRRCRTCQALRLRRKRRREREVREQQRAAS